MTINDKFIGETPLKDQHKKKLAWQLKDKAIKNKHLDDNSISTSKLKDKVITPEKISDNFIAAVVKPLYDAIDNKYRAITNELYTMVKSLQVGGVALSDRLGNREDIGVTQKELTALFNALNGRIDDIAGVWTGGFSMVVSPDSFISEDTAEVNISAGCDTGTFDHIAFYGNDELIVEGDQVSTLVHTTTISESTEIKCVATILGVEYTKKKMITKYYPFFVGAGKSLQEVLIPENARPYDGTLAHDYDISCKDEDRIYVLIPLSIQSQVVRIDMNSYEIPMDRLTDGKNVIYISKNTYRAGIHNIDITNNEADVSLADLQRIDELFDNQ